MSTRNKSIYNLCGFNRARKSMQYAILNIKIIKGKKICILQSNIFYANVCIYREKDVTDHKKVDMLKISMR